MGIGQFDLHFPVDYVDELVVVYVDVVKKHLQLAFIQIQWD